MSNPNDLATTFDPKTYDSTFIADLVAFVGANEFQSLFEKFFLQYSVEFSDAEEHPLRYTEIYEKFQNLFETQLETFCQSKGIHQKDFVKKCREVSTKDTQTQKYIDILLSSVEYETFVRLMQFMRPIAIERAKHEALSNKNDAEPKVKSTQRRESKELGVSSPRRESGNPEHASSKGVPVTPTSGSKASAASDATSETKANPMRTSLSAKGNK